MADFRHLTREEARERAERAARFLAADRRVRLVFLFGSAADPDRAASRDVDLAILTDPMEFHDFMGLWGEVTLAAEGEIDLVWLNEAPPVLAREVTDGECLYADPPEAETEFVTRARMQYLDFKHYLDEQWRIMRERQKERQDGLQA
jgi:predicted nucleotidyltransferase